MKNSFMKKMIVYILALLLSVPMICPINTQAAKLNYSQKTLVIGQTCKFKVKNTSKDVKWSSSDKKIATVSSDGVVTAKKTGTATITAKVGKKKLVCKVTVITQQKSYENKLIKEINKERRKYGLPSYDKNYLLQSAARKRAKELATRFSHTRPNGDRWTSAISMSYNYGVAAENVARKYAEPDKVVDAWMEIGKHKAKIISKKYDEIGVGVYLADNGYLYWCAIFANEK